MGGQRTSPREEGDSAGRFLRTLLRRSLAHRTARPRARPPPPTPPVSVQSGTYRDPYVMSPSKPPSPTVLIGDTPPHQRPFRRRFHIAEEVVLDTTVDRGDEEPGEDASPGDVALDRKTARGNADPRDDTLTTDVVLDPIEVRDDEEVQEEALGEEARLPTNDPCNFVDTASEDGIVPMPVTNPTPPTDPDPPLKDSTPSAPFHIEVNTVFEPKSAQDHKPELTFTSPPSTAPNQPSDNYDREWL
ncbi:hypothetical protein THAOC_34553, partial [Thalassiosira oceanica]